MIVASGTFNTPQLLMLSGIGPAAHLREHGIKTVADLPVGKNLQDHLAVLIIFARKDFSAFHSEMRFDRMARNMIQAHFFGTGPGTVVPGGLHAFVKTRPELAVPDIEFMFRGLPPHAHLWFPGLKKPYVDGYGIRPTLLHPDSRGEILLRSADPARVDAHHLQFLQRAERPAEPARRLQARARRGLSAAARSPIAVSRPRRAKR